MLWIRVQTSLRSHPKIFRLAREIEADRSTAVGLLVGVWSYAAEHHLDGDVTHTELEALHEALDWHAEDVRVPLLAAGWIDNENGALLLHDWDEYQGVLIDRRRKDAERKREERARRRQEGAEAAHATTEQQAPSQSTALVPIAIQHQGVLQTVSRDTGASVDVISQRLGNVRVRAGQRRERDAVLCTLAEIVFAYWRDSLGKNPNVTLLSPEREKRIVKALKQNDGDVHEILYAIDGARRDQWLMGTDPKSTRRFDGLEHILRDRDQIERLRDLAPGNKARPHPFLAPEEAP